MKKGRPETIPGILKLIHRERDRLRHRGDVQNPQSSPNEAHTDVDVILLSGGLGSSEYIKYKIEESLVDGRNGETASVPKVCTISEPQNCICRGLLEDRIFGLWRAGKSNGSYGILQKERYTRWKWRHFIAKLRKQVVGYGNQRYVEQVTWLICKVRQSVAGLFRYFADRKKDDAKPASLPVHRHTFDADPQQCVVEVVVSPDPKPSRYTRRGMRPPKNPVFVGQNMC